MTGAIPNTKIITALKRTHGNLMLSAKMLGCSRETIRKRAEKSPEIKQVIEEERAGFVDIAEGALYTATVNGEAWAVQFALRNLGADRGYVPMIKQEHTGPGGGPMETVIRDMPDDEIEKRARQILERRSK